MLLRFACIALLLGSAASAALADYRGPVRFQPQTFRTIRPQSITRPTLPKATFRRDNIRPTTINQPRIQYAPINQPTPPRANFRFDGSIFGYVNEGAPPRTTRPQATSSRSPSQSRPTSRRQPLGW